MTRSSMNMVTYVILGLLFAGTAQAADRWTVTNPYDATEQKTVTKDRRGNYTVTDPYDATYRREIRRTYQGGYIETDPFDATYRREWRKQ